MIEKVIEVNDTFTIEITYNENDHVNRLYTLVAISNGEYQTLIKEFNRDKFLLEVNKYIKLSNKIECLVASY